MIDPADAQWIGLTHPDRDHTEDCSGCSTPRPGRRVITTFRRVITTFIGAGIMSTERPLPLNRVHLLDPGQILDVGDRRLTAIRPPLLDNPSTVGFYDDRSGAFFSPDCFGAPMPHRRPRYL